MNIYEAIHSIRPGATWRLVGGNYAGLEWRDAQQSKPTEQEVAAAMALSAHVTVDAVKAEAQRRIIALMGARDFSDCIVKQLNANKRAVELNDKRTSGGTLTAEEEATAQYLRNVAVAVDAIRAASNVLEATDPIPANYTDNQYWP